MCGDIALLFQALLLSDGTDQRTVHCMSLCWQQGTSPYIIFFNGQKKERNYIPVQKSYVDRQIVKKKRKKKPAVMKVKLLTAF